MSDTYYSIKEVAAIVKVSYLTVYRWIQADKLKSYRAVKQYRIKKQDLERFMKGRK